MAVILAAESQERSALIGMSLGEIMENEDKKSLVGGIIQEVADIAVKKDIMLPENIIEDSLNRAKNFPYDTKTSYQRDVELKGRLNEGDLFG
ncbi:MAG: hypothetical protein JXL81_14735, partial [Deltaproteobacteria bacterium]|nr:hypothetical protein [Deltaproteobacteria bacterium]